MVVGASFTSLGLAAGALLFFGPGASPLLAEILGLVAVASAFVAICSAEARFAS
ncbi:hypothetical protein [Enterovirga aerilata]|uniref:Uncharacterized protein n=1 Tax=Enterovirga aerilata TaxID=2730920 RepID=A0A849I656_9HYPH|nr:hypothetical protein [Enterovirga sp. DB1703]NNM73174.1 hypothetical protein [Enterovirga sp. DB1703]